MSTSAKTRKAREAWEKTSYGWRTLVGRVGAALIYAYAVDDFLPLAYGVSLAEKGTSDEIVLFEHEDKNLELGLEEAQARALELAQRVLNSLRKIERKA